MWLPSFLRKKPAGREFVISGDDAIALRRLADEFEVEGCKHRHLLKSRFWGVVESIYPETVDGAWRVEFGRRKVFVFQGNLPSGKDGIDRL